MNKKRLTYVVLGFTIFGYAYFVSGDFWEKRYRGEYVTGFEVNVFHPCGEKERWWVESDSVAQFEQAFSVFEIPQDIFDVRSLYVEWRGKKSHSGHFGHLGHSHRKIWVSNIDKVKKYDGECSQGNE